MTVLKYSYVYPSYISFHIRRHCFITGVAWATVIFTLCSLWSVIFRSHTHDFFLKLLVCSSDKWKSYGKAWGWKECSFLFNPFLCILFPCVPLCSIWIVVVALTFTQVCFWPDTCTFNWVKFALSICTFTWVIFLSIFTHLSLWYIQKEAKKLKII